MDPADYAAHFERIRVWKESQVHVIQEKKEGGDRRASGFLARLAKKVRDNLQIHVHTFQIRWHDGRAQSDGVSSIPSLCWTTCSARRTKCASLFVSQRAEGACQGCAGMQDQVEGFRNQGVLEVPGPGFHMLRTRSPYFPRVVLLFL